MGPLVQVRTGSKARPVPAPSSRPLQLSKQPNTDHPDARHEHEHERLCSFVLSRRALEPERERGGRGRGRKRRGRRSSRPCGAAAAFPEPAAAAGTPRSSSAHRWSRSRRFRSGRLAYSLSSCERDSEIDARWCCILGGCGSIAMPPCPSFSMSPKRG